MVVTRSQAVEKDESVESRISALEELVADRNRLMKDLAEMVEMMRRATTTKAPVNQSSPMTSATLDPQSDCSESYKEERFEDVCDDPIAEPLRAMVLGAPLEDARHLAQRYDRRRQEAEAQAAEVARRQAKARESQGNPDILMKLESAETKLQDLKSNMTTLGKEAASALASVEDQQQKLDDLYYKIKDHDSHVWHRWKNKTPHENSLMLLQHRKPHGSTKLLWLLLQNGTLVWLSWITFVPYELVVKEGFHERLQPYRPKLQLHFLIVTLVVQKIRSSTLKMVIRFHFLKPLRGVKTCFAVLDIFLLWLVFFLSRITKEKQDSGGNFSTAEATMELLINLVVKVFQKGEI